MGSHQTIPLPCAQNKISGAHKTGTPALGSVEGGPNGSVGHVVRRSMNSVPKARSLVNSGPKRVAVLTEVGGGGAV